MLMPTPVRLPLLTLSLALVLVLVLMLALAVVLLPSRRMMIMQLVPLMVLLVRLC
jgi:hypothetical protein